MKNFVLLVACSFLPFHIFGQIPSSGVMLKNFSKSLKVVNADDGGYLVVGLDRNGQYNEQLNREAKKCYYLTKLDKSGNLRLRNISKLQEDEMIHDMWNINGPNYLIIKSKGDSKTKLNNNFYIQEINEANVVMWEKEIGNYNQLGFISGSMNSKESFKLLFEVKPGTYELISFDNKGSKQFNKLLNLGKSHTLNSLTLSSTDDILLVGGVEKVKQRNEYYDEMFAILLDSKGITKWEKFFPTSGSSNAIKAVAEGDGFVIGGSVQHTRYKDRGINKSYLKEGPEQIRILKISNSGAVNWDRRYGGYGSEKFRDINIWNNNKIVVFGTNDLPDNEIEYNYGKNDIWIFSLNMKGKLIKEKSFGSKDNEMFNYQLLDSKGDFVVFGEVGRWNNTSQWVFTLEDEFYSYLNSEKGMPKMDTIQYRTVDSLYSKKDYDKFLWYSLFHKQEGIANKEYLKNMKNGDLIKYDWNQDGKLDLLVFGEDIDENYILYTVISDKGNTYRGVDLYHVNNITDFDLDTATINGTNIIIVEQNAMNWKKPKIDTLAFINENFINFNVEPIKEKDIKVIEYEMTDNVSLPVILRLSSDKKFEAYTFNDEKKYNKKIGEWKTSKEQFNRILDYVSTIQYGSKEGYYSELNPYTNKLSISLKDGEQLVQSGCNPCSNLRTYRLLHDMFEQEYKNIAIQYRSGW